MTLNGKIAIYPDKLPDHLNGSYLIIDSSGNIKWIQNNIQDDGSSSTEEFDIVKNGAIVC